MRAYVVDSGGFQEASLYLDFDCSRLDRQHLRRYHEYSEREVLRPGVTRLSFTYFMSREAVDYVVAAVAMVARHGWRLLPDVSEFRIQREVM